MPECAAGRLAQSDLALAFLSVGYFNEVVWGDSLPEVAETRKGDPV